MKRVRLPLTALRSFEAAGRHLSFSKAAEELFVSQAAISRQVRELEDTVGQPLFTRLHRKVELTDIGKRLLTQLTQSFDEIDRRLSEVLAPAAQYLLKVSVEPSFAAAMLIPRLNKFHHLHPEVDVSADADMRLIEFRGTDIELAVRYGTRTGTWPRVQSRPIMSVGLIPVLAPALLESGPPLRTPADLRHYPLLHDSNRDTWKFWFEGAGLPEMAAQRGSIYPDSALVMQAAKLGHGVALGDRVMESPELAEGTLVQPFEFETPYGGFYLVAADFERLSPAAKAFADWLIAEYRMKRSFDAA